MPDWRDVLVSPETSIIEALRIIDRGALRLALVVDEKKRLLGIVADGDIRRGLLRNVDLSARIGEVMNSAPTVATAASSREQRVSLMQQRGLHQLPVLDEHGRIIALETIDALFVPPQRDNWVVLMAGGRGSRLEPLTQTCPKPLLRVATKPVLQIILESFTEQGFRTFFMSVNYKAQMIKDHFGDGSSWGVSINYLEETQRLGTAGALSLLPEPPPSPIVVMNGDIMTRANFGQLLDFHAQQHAEATMCVREYEHIVPYGVVRTDHQWLTNIDEKPSFKCFVSAGMYVINPSVITRLSRNEPLDMPAVFNSILARGGRTTVFPLHEYWLDIGRIEDFERANREFEERPE